MPYLQSYAMRGDPGLLGSLGRFVSGAVSGFARGGPIGAVTGAVSKLSGRKNIRPVRQAPQRPLTITPRNFLPGGPPLISRGADQGLPPRGYRLNKTGYHLKDGTYVAPGTRYVKVRRRNPANPRALRKALSRAESFGGLVKRARKTTRKLKSI